MTAGSLSHRERFLRTLQFQPVDRLPDLEFGAWQQTIDRWQQEGMTAAPNAVHGVLDLYFNVDSSEWGPGLNVRNGLCPAFDKIVLEERGTHQIVQDADGTIAEQIRPELGASIPHYIRHAIVTRADWQKIRDERLDPDNPDRFPPHLDAICRRLNKAEYPITFSCGSLYGWLRNWMGVEHVSLTLYDDRPWIEEMMEHLTDLTLAILSKLAGKVRIDLGAWWEDMCGNHGSLLSPRMFSEMMVPRYKRVNDFLRKEFGTELNHVDCDGNIHELVSLWLDGGVNVMFPIEVAHTDAYRIAQEFGRRAPMRGAYDKRALIEGPAAIDAEFARIAPLMKRGGLIPHTDHLVPPDVSLANYTYYRRRKCEILGKPWRETGFRYWPGHITSWRLLGPFDNAHNAGFHAAYAPENEAAGEGPLTGKDGRALHWQTYQGAAQSGYVDLKTSVSAEPWSVAYAACSVFSPDEREAWLEMGSDDGIKVWANGAEVFSKDAYRTAWPRQDLAPVHLRKGWNPLLVKVGQAEGEWGFYLRLTDDAGQPMTDVKVKV
jgi:hypothetical protein